MKKLIVTIVLVATLLIGGTIPVSAGKPCGRDWRVCTALTCKYRPRLYPSTKVAWKGVQIHIGSATPVGGGWAVASCK